MTAAMPPGLDHKQQHPSIEKADGGMKGLAQIRVLAANFRPERRQFGIDERAQHGDHAADDPDAEDQQGRVQLLRDDVRVDEDAGADNAAHDDHGGVEQPDLPKQSGEVRCDCCGELDGRMQACATTARL